jgi:hypothetical protein
LCFRGESKIKIKDNLPAGRQEDKSNQQIDRIRTVAEIHRGVTEIHREKAYDKSQKSENE